MPRWAAVIAAALVVTFAVRVHRGIVTWSATADEPQYVTAGYSYIATGDLRLDAWHPPLAFALAGLAVRARYDLAFPPAGGDDAWRSADVAQLARMFLYDEHRGDPTAADVLRAARLPSLLFGVLTVLVAAWWARALWGWRAGLAALALATCEPTLIAHAALATPDVELTALVLVTTVLAWRFARAPSRWRWAAVVAAATAAVATKHVALLVAPAIVIALAEQLAGERASRPRVVAVARPIAESVGALAVVAAVVALATGGAILVAVFGGIRDQLWHVQHPPTAFLHGAISKTGWWYYFPVALLVKLPLGTLALLAVSLARWRAGAALTRGVGGWLIAPALVFLAFMIWTHIDLGVRLVLPCYPFAIVLAARAATLPGRAGYVAAALVVATAASSLASWGRELSYFNEAAGDGAGWLSDSNLDWGQDLDALATALREADAPPVYLAYFGGGSPSYLGIRHETIAAYAGSPADADAVPGTDRSEPGAPCAATRQWIAVSAFRAQGLAEPAADRFAWLASRTPIIEAGATFAVYDVTGDADAHLRIAAMFGPASPAARCETARAAALAARAVPAP
jgi:hypothetical protein